MARQARVDSPTGIQHVTSRGAGRRAIFEDDIDRVRYLEKLREFSIRDGVNVLAWCLMENHVHLLLKSDTGSLESLMRSLNISHAQWFNGRHGHVGPVFQGRYSSTSVENEAHLVECVRYIHRNPEVAGVAETRRYPWSSYGEYIGSTTGYMPGLCSTSLVLGLIDDFEGFHDANSIETDFVETVPARRVISDGEVMAFAKNLFGEECIGSIAAMEKCERNRALMRLYVAGASIRQLERITGIGRGVIQKAVRR